MDQVVRRLGEGFCPPGLDVVCDGALWTQFSPGPGDDPVGLSGGSLSGVWRRRRSASAGSGVTLAVQRVAEDFFLPSPTGSGCP